MTSASVTVSSFQAGTRFAILLPRTFYTLNLKGHKCDIFLKVLHVLVTIRYVVELTIDAMCVNPR